MWEYNVQLGQRIFYNLTLFCIAIGYKDEVAFLSEEARPQMQEIDKDVKTKLQEARDCMHAAREKHGYSTSFKSAQCKRQKGKKSACEPSTSQTPDSVTVVDSESDCENDS